MPDEEHEPPHQGRVVNGYRILELIGSGGASRVYRAENRAGAIVALKVVQFDEMAADYERRLRREPEIQRGAGHENIVRIDDWFRIGNEFFLVLEYVDGASLWRSIHHDRGPLPFEEARGILRQILPAVGHLHGLGIIHRDIKPGNILVARDGKARLADFGIAKYNWQQGQTRTQAGIGTPEYMSPEQARGLAVDHRTDIYSLGITLYEMLSGRTPFSQGEETPAGYMEVIRGILTDPIPDPRSYTPSIPSGAVSLIVCATAKDPAARFASVDDLSRALDAVDPEDRAPATVAGVVAAVEGDGAASDAGASAGPAAGGSAGPGETRWSTKRLAGMRPWLAATLLLVLTVVGLAAAGLFTSKSDGNRAGPESSTHPPLDPAAIAASIASRYEGASLNHDATRIALLYTPVVDSYLGRDTVTRDSVRALVLRELARVRRTDSFDVSIDTAFARGDSAIELRWRADYRRIREDSVAYSGSTSDELALALVGSAWLVRSHERRLIAGSLPEGPAAAATSSGSEKPRSARRPTAAQAATRPTAPTVISSPRRPGVEIRIGPQIRVEWNRNPAGGGKGEGKGKGRGKGKK